MKSASSVLKFYYHLKLASLYANDFLNENPNTIFLKLFKGFVSKIEWIYSSSVTSIELNKHIPSVVQILKEKWNSDVLTEMSVIDKITLLSDEQIEPLETLIDELLKGEKIEIQFINQEKC
jgi:hypothetical protein